MEKTTKWHVIEDGNFVVVDQRGLKHGQYSMSVFYSKEEAQKEADYRNNNENE